jgi:hypothetical protein
VGEGEGGVRGGPLPTLEQVDAWFLTWLSPASFSKCFKLSGDYRGAPLTAAVRELLEDEGRGGCGVGTSEAVWG